MTNMTMTRIGIIAVCLLTPLVGAAQSTYTEQSLFTVEYGWEPWKIGSYVHMLTDRFQQGVPLLSGILVNDKGDVWLGEAKDCMAKGFTYDGEFVRVVGYRRLQPSDLPHEPHRLPPEYKGYPWAFATGLVDFAMDRRGISYLLVNPDTRVIVFDADGEPIQSRIAADGLCYELRGWEKICYQLRQEMDVVWPVVEDVWCDIDNNVYLAVSDPSDAPEATSQAKIAQFSETLDFIGWRPGRYVGPDGKTYGFAAKSAERVGSELAKFTAKGKHMDTVRLIPPPQIAPTDYQAEGGWAIPDGVLVDAYENVYLVFSDPVGDSPRTDLWTEAQVTVRIYKFSETGDFITKVSLPSVARTASLPCVAVDSFGDIYYAMYRKTGVEVHHQSTMLRP